MLQHAAQCAAMCVEGQGSSVLCGVQQPINGQCNCLCTKSARACVLPLGSTHTRHSSLICRQTLCEVIVLLLLTPTVTNKDKVVR